MFKPIYYITSALLFGAACLSYSCSSNFSEPQTNPPAQAEDEILSVFLDLNKSFKPEVQSRSESFDKGLAIVLADAFGAKEGSWFGCKVGKFFGPKGVIVGGVAGATIFGAAASYVAYKEKYSNNSQLLSITSQKSEYPEQVAFCEGYAIAEKSIVYNDYAVGVSLGLDSASTKIGILHNKVLDLVETSTEIFTDTDYTSNLDSMQREIVFSPDFIAEYQSIITGTKQDEIRHKTISDQIMDLFCEAVSESCASKEDLHNIIKQYKIKIHELAIYGYDDTVERDQDGNLIIHKEYLPLDEVEQLYVGLAVAAYSFDYWSSILSSSNE